MTSLISQQQSLADQAEPNWHATAAGELLEAMSIDVEGGLSAQRVDQLRQRYGPNCLTEAPPAPAWHKLLAQFRDLIIWILIVAAIVSGALGEWVDAIAILAIVLLNGVIGFFQQQRAERALAALQKLSAPMAKAVRDGLIQVVPANDLVPGDLIEVEAGDNVPADARLLQTFGLTLQEAALTGESLPSEKEAEIVLGPTTPLGDRRNMLYMGTVTAAGKGRAVVVATGMRTELGRIAGMLQRQESEPTPLQRRLAELGRVLIVVCLVIVGVIFALQMLRGGQFVDAFLLSVCLAVAAVPEGLPAVVTIALALGVQRMVKRNALVRRLSSVETLGSVTVICSDKTGTLTRNEMTVREIVAGGACFKVSGTGYVPQGQFFCVGGGLQEESNSPTALDGRAVDVTQEADLRLALTVGAWCNNAQVVPRGNGSQAWQVIGDPTEGALLVVGLKGGVEAIHRSRGMLYEIPFDSARRAMSVIVRGADGGSVLYIKGAPEVILEKSVAEQVAGHVVPLTAQRRETILQQNTDMASRALRVLALAYRPNPPHRRQEDPETALVFVGLVGMIDPPRDEARLAVAKCHDAGIRPIMITGDHPATALAVARELGLSQAGQTALSGQELDCLSEDELTAQVESISVYARASAEHKLRIVRAWKSRGQIVAMTGDGVNDAPAVKAADIGIAMGITGTDVTKEASDMVLTDDNFASIVNAVEEGRCIYDNIQKVLLFLLSCNAGEILLMLVAALLGWPAPLLPIQLLWINLVTDGLPALALSLEPPEPGIMGHRPRPPKESILTARVSLMIAVQGIIIGAVGLIAFGMTYLQDKNAESARALTFCAVVYAQLLCSLAARSRWLTFWQLGVFSNPILLLAVVVSGLLQVSVAIVPFTQRVFDVHAHSGQQWFIIGLLALAPVTLIELGKLAVRFWTGKSTRPTGSRPNAINTLSNVSSQ